jgi:hypothetical protein
LLTNNPQNRCCATTASGRAAPLVTNSNTHNEALLARHIERAGHLAEEWGRSLASES